MTDPALSPDAPLRRLLAALPDQVRRSYERLRTPKTVWLRLPLALLLILGGCVGFLPALGFWMIPIGVLLMAEDVPALRAPAMKALGTIQGWWDQFRGRGIAR